MNNMIDVIEITDKEERLSLTVKKTFLEKCPEPSKHTLMELNKDFNMMTYLHNETGPALKFIKKKSIPKELQKLIDVNKYFLADGPQRVEYWLDGHCINRENPEMAQKMHHSTQFNKKLNEFIDTEGQHD